MQFTQFSFHSQLDENVEFVFFSNLQPFFTFSPECIENETFLRTRSSPGRYLVE